LEGSGAERLRRIIDDYGLRLWQASVIEYLLLERDETTSYAPRELNMELGWQAQTPRQYGQTFLAAVILKELPSVMVVPTDIDKKRILNKYKWLQDREGMILVSKHLEREQKRAVMERKIPPLDKAGICIVDGASRLSQWELEPLRCADWIKYVELG